ncbi:MAG TPA: peptide deformylase [Cyclobacteriaceae bacterium]|jgi:peptide deformylase
MIYPIIVYGDPILKKRAEEIKKNELDVLQLAEDMFETMYNASGVGLAAPQIGISKRIFVIDGSAVEEPQLEGFKKIFINPEIKDEDGLPWPYEEGCLSIPNIREDILRNPKIRVTYLDENWEEHTEEYEGLKARIIQHEYDHLEGILFTDYLSGFKKRLLKGKLQNIKKGNVETSYPIKVIVK